jgi:uncharacterized membrane protein
MRVERLAAFTDGVVAIIITIMVLELKVPASGELHTLLAAAPILGAYVLSYVNVGLYWNNHHHLIQTAENVDGQGLWANLFLLFWLSLVPFVIRWIGEAGFVAAPVAAYGLVLGMAAVGYHWLQYAIIEANGGASSTLAEALGRDRKGMWSIIGYVLAMIAAFLEPLVAIGIYVAIAAVWLIPDQRIERRLTESR